MSRPVTLQATGPDGTRVHASGRTRAEAQRALVREVERVTGLVATPGTIGRGGARFARPDRFAELPPGPYSCVMFRAADGRLTWHCTRQPSRFAEKCSCKGTCRCHGNHAERFDSSDCQWITIGGREKDGKRHGGSPVCIRDGKIVKGAPALSGRHVGNLKAGPEEQSRQKEAKGARDYERASWGKKARAAGIDPSHLHGLADEIQAHDAAFVDDRKAMLQDARRHAKQLGSDLTTLKARSGKGIDPAAVRHLDDIAQSMASSYPEQFAGHEDDATARLFDLLAEGNPQRMSKDQAYKQAWEQLEPDANWSRRRSRDLEDAPFSERRFAPADARLYRDLVRFAVG